MSAERRSSILSQPLSARACGAAVRSHWSGENRVHWILDVAFREDESRIRTDHAPATMAILRPMALTLLTQERTAKVGTTAKRLKAGWDPTYLLTVLQANLDVIALWCYPGLVNYQFAGSSKPRFSVHAEHGVSGEPDSPHRHRSARMASLRIIHEPCGVTPEGLTVHCSLVYDRGAN